VLDVNGLKVYENYLDVDAQKRFLALIEAIVTASPFFDPISPYSKKPMGTLMTNAGELGWCADVENGFRYQTEHPVTGQLWAQMPDELIAIWNDVAGYELLPECCLVNYYNNNSAKLGMHKDIDEDNFDAPIVSVSLGDTCKFRMGLTEKPSPTKSFDLHSGTVLVMGGKTARNAYHGVDRIKFGSSDLLKSNAMFSDGGRLSLTLRRVTK